MSLVLSISINLLTYRWFDPDNNFTGSVTTFGTVSSTPSTPLALLEKCSHLCNNATNIFILCYVSTLFVKYKQQKNAS